MMRGPDIRVVSTYDEIAANCVAVRELLAEQGIRLHRDSALAVLLRDAECEARDFAEGSPLRSRNVLIRTAQANRVSSAILAHGHEPATKECLRRMTSGAMDLSERATSTGKDALWEIELAARLRAQGLAARLAEPDILIRIDGLDYPIACKKIYSLRGVEAQMRKGVAQLERFGSPGLVAFSIDDLTPAHSVFVSNDVRAAGDELAKLNRAFINSQQRVLERFLADGRCHGVMVNTSVVADLALTRPRLNSFSQTTIWSLTPPHSPTSSAFAHIVEQLRNLTNE